jgi:hypothetical protein
VEGNCHWLYEQNIHHDRASAFIFNSTNSIFPLILIPLQNTVDKLVQRANASILIGTSSWKEQFVEALTVNPGELLRENSILNAD